MRWRMFVLMVAGLLWASSVAAQSAPTCDEERVLLRTIVGITAASRERLEIDLAQTLVKLRAALAELERLKTDRK